MFTYEDDVLRRGTTPLADSPFVGNKPLIFSCDGLVPLGSTGLGDQLFFQGLPGDGRFNVVMV